MGSLVHRNLSASTILHMVNNALVGAVVLLSL